MLLAGLDQLTALSADTGILGKPFTRVLPNQGVGAQFAESGSRRLLESRIALHRIDDRHWGSITEYPHEQLLPQYCLRMVHL